MQRIERALEFLVAASLNLTLTLSSSCSRSAAYVQWVKGFNDTGSGPLSLVRCSITDLNFYARAGADATLGLISAGSPSLEIKRTKFAQREPDLDACGPKGNDSQ